MYFSFFFQEPFLSILQFQLPISKKGESYRNRFLNSQEVFEESSFNDFLGLNRPPFAHLGLA